MRRPPPHLALPLLLTLLLAGSLTLDQGTALATAMTAPDPPRVDLALTPPGTTERFVWPLAPPHPVLRPFRAPDGPYGPGHRGVDLGGQAGDPVMAADGGLVLYAGLLVDRSLVSVEHPGGLRTTYEPVAPSVRVGEYVRRGQVIGTLLAGHPGCPATATMVCLHWGAHRQRDYLDPLRLVGIGRIRLLPWSQPASGALGVGQFGS